MSRKIIWGCVLGFAFAAAGLGQRLPEGKGRAETQRVCSMCHGVEIFTKLSMGADQWSAVVDDMVSRGAQGTDDEFERIVNYLAANFGKKADVDSKAAGAPKVNVNSVSAAELAEGLGLTRTDAETIVQYRKDKGDFKDWADLRKVPGIDLKKLEDQKDRIAFTPAPVHDK